MQITVFEVARINRAVCQRQLAVAVIIISFVMPFVNVTVRQCFLDFATVKAIACKFAVAKVLVWIGYLAHPLLHIIDKFTNVGILGALFRTVSMPFTCLKASSSDKILWS